MIRVYSRRFGPNVELKSQLFEWVDELKLHSAFIMTCVGSLTKATLRFAEQPERTVPKTIKTFDEHFEICGLVGTISPGKKGHLHIVLSRNDGSVIAGHVVDDLVIFSTAEVVIGESINEKYSRIYDPETGYNELKIDNVS